MKGDQGATWCVIILQPDCSRWSHQSSCSFLWTIWIQDPIPWMPGEMLETSSSHRLTYRNKVGEVLAKPSGRWAPASLLKRPTIGKCSLPHNKTLTTAYKSQASMLQHIGREFTHYIHNNILYFLCIYNIYLSLCCKRHKPLKPSSSLESIFCCTVNDGTRKGSTQTSKDIYNWW